jgi:tungstate transport system permease protein
MNFLFDAFGEALRLLFGFDAELVHIVGVSLKVSLASTGLALVLGVPVGFMVGAGRFRGRRAAATLLNTLMARPTVAVGLFVFALLTRAGPLGSLGILYTPWAVILGQTVLATPIIAALTMAAVEGADPRIAETARTLGAGRLSVSWAVLWESRLAVLAAVTAGFGRVFAEVGVAMMLGGNIRWYTRTITTTMALSSSKGEFALALALGLVLLAIAFVLNLAVQLLRTNREPS